MFLKRFFFHSTAVLYDFHDSNDTFEILEVVLANSYTWVTNQLPTHSLAIFNSGNGGCHFANLVPFVNI